MNTETTGMMTRSIIAAVLFLGLTDCDKSKGTAPTDPSTTSAPPVASGPDLPADSYVKTFGMEIADGWIGKNGARNNGSYLISRSVRDITKRTTDSILHPTVWTFVIDDSSEDPVVTYNFSFYWDGQRFVASDATYRSGNAAPTAISLDRLNQVAKRVQAQ